MNYEALASELIRALRGKRSQAGLSRRLGYHTNVAYSWEAGEGYPTAAKTMRLAKRTGVDPTQAVTAFYGRPPPWLATADLTTKAGVRQLLEDLRGHSNVTSVAKATGRDRFAVARWMKGQTEPRLPDFLRLVEACSLRLIDFLAAFVNPEALPQVEKQWRALQAARSAAYDMPWSHAVLRGLELQGYKALARHERGWLAAHVGLTIEQEDQCLRLLASARQIHWRGRRWQVRNVSTVDTRHDPQASRKLGSWCAAQGLARLENPKRGSFAFNLFAVSAADLEKLRQLQRDYFNHLRSIVASSSSSEHVAIVNMQLFTLDEELNESRPLLSCP